MLDQRRVEKIQRRATRLLPHLQDKSYSERLSALSLPSLSYRRHRGDLILLYKIINNYFNSDFTDLFTYSTSSTRGHQFKLLVLHTLAYLVGTLPLCLKGRFYAKLVFVSKGKILRHCCLYVLNGNILRQNNDAKPNTYMHIDSYIKGKFYAVYHHHYNT